MKKKDVPKFKSDGSTSYSRSRVYPQYVNHCNMLRVCASCSQYEAVILGHRILTPLNGKMSSIFSRISLTSAVQWQSYIKGSFWARYQSLCRSSRSVSPHKVRTRRRNYSSSEYPRNRVKALRRALSFKQHVKVLFIIFLNSVQ